jgi:hypothetical protein
MRAVWRSAQEPPGGDNSISNFEGFMGVAAIEVIGRQR